MKSLGIDAYLALGVAMLISLALVMAIRRPRAFGPATVIGPLAGIVLGVGLFAVISQRYWTWHWLVYVWIGLSLIGLMLYALFRRSRRPRPPRSRPPNFP